MSKSPGSRPHRPWAQLLRTALKQGWHAVKACWRGRPQAEPVTDANHARGRDAPRSAEACTAAWLDMEQMVDFYMALGMVNAAVELLTEHLKAADWAGPLPYLKLLDIHAKDDNRNAYALTKTLLEQRYAIKASPWPKRAAPAKAQASTKRQAENV